MNHLFAFVEMTTKSIVAGVLDFQEHLRVVYYFRGRIYLYIACLSALNTVKQDIFEIFILENWQGSLLS